MREDIFSYGAQHVSTLRLHPSSRHFTRRCDFGGPWLAVVMTRMSSSESLDTLPETETDDAP